MANFLITTVSQSFLSKKNSIINTFKKAPLLQMLGLFDEEDTWKKDKISPRLAELTIQKSAYNEVIPSLYGTSRLAGNVIWATDIREVEENNIINYSTGKGGKKIYQNNITYYYYIDLAIAICAGEVTELKKVWADTYLLDLSLYRYRLYYGTEDQEADPIIQSNEGVDKTPAYRGLCYIVFENLCLNEFGNRIPNFTFEVARNYVSDSEVENLVTGVNIIPGCGEFVYDTEVISKQEGTIWFGDFYPHEGVIRINQNNNSNEADAVLATEQLKLSLPNCKWVAPVVCWFGDSTNVSDCKILPKVEYKYNLNDENTVINLPEDWKVDGIVRSNAELVGNDGGVLRYGGTVSDNSIFRYLQYLKSENFSVMFYPMVFMDLPDKPWRGYLTGSAEDVRDFFVKPNGYNRFILHYANLVKDFVDCFIIGSEFRDLTKIRDADGNFPAVDCLIDLAAQVRVVLGANVKISYAADWSEYHHCDGGWYNMDKLWASPNIDFVGIDAYFPLTDKKEIEITMDDVKNGWTSGEGYDWIYADDNRTLKEPIESRFAWKNIEWWWSNEHVNPDGTKTPWVPQSKKIWFTEYGFASVDGTTNEPNKFYDPNCVDGGFPRFSDGKADNFVQRRAIQATEEVWKNSPMVEQKFLWCWDARPYPFFPSKLDIWSDGNVWHYGHWINGKLGALIFSECIKKILMDAEADLGLIGQIGVYDNIGGLVLNNITTVNDALGILQKAYFFDYYEQDGKLYIMDKKTESFIDISEDELIEIDKEVYFETNILGETEFPNKVDLSFLDKDLDYQSCNTHAERSEISETRKIFDSLPMVLSDFRAKQIAEKLLYSLWLEKNIYSFRLPPKYIYLNSADIIKLNELVLRILNISVNVDNTIDIKAVQADNSIYSFEREENKFEIIDIIKPLCKTNMEVFELPAISNLDSPEVFFATTGEEDGWSGCGIYSAKVGSNNFQLINISNANSIVGTCLNKLEVANPYYFDKKNELFVAFGSHIDTSILQNAEMFDLLDGENLALIGNELIQFKNIELQPDGTFKLYNFLRGQQATEEFINTHIKGEKFIFINRGLISNKLTTNDLDITFNFKAVTLKESFDISTDKTLKIEGKNLKPLKPVHIKIDGNLIKWCCRNRGNQGWKDGFEILENRGYIVTITRYDDSVESFVVENKEWLEFEGEVKNVDVIRIV